MENIYSEEIQQFISANDLTRQAGLLLFDAEIILQHQGNSKHLFSQVQIINLDNVTALYIYEFFKTEYNTPEMYSTEEFLFTCSEKKLEIRGKAGVADLYISVNPVANQGITSLY